MHEDLMALAEHKLRCWNTVSVTHDDDDKFSDYLEQT